MSGLDRAGRALELVAVALTLLSCSTPSASPSPAASATASVAALTPTAAPAGTRAPSTNIRTTRVASIPKDFSYIASAVVRDMTLWLVDLSGGVPPVAVAQWTGGGSDQVTASRDGKTVIVGAPGAHSILALHLVRPLTGEATILFEGPPDGRAFYPHLAPDGGSFAFTVLRDTGGDGLLIGDIATGVTRQLIPYGKTPGMNGRPDPLEWSDDGLWLAYVQEEVAPEGPGCCTYLANVNDGRRVRLGRGLLPSWRASEPRLLAAVLGGNGNQGAFGATVYSFDLTAQHRTELFTIEPKITTLAWNPTKDEFLYVAETSGCSYHGTLWTRTLAGATTRIGVLDTVQRAWWSADGAAIYALIRGDGPDGSVVEALSGKRTATIPGDAGTLRCP